MDARIARDHQMRFRFSLSVQHPEHANSSDAFVTNAISTSEGRDAVEPHVFHRSP